MAISVFDLFSIGIGPSSSHTVGPMRAAKSFVDRLRESGRLSRLASIRATLYGSLGATGRGHGSDKAILAGLAGNSPDLVEPQVLAELVDQTEKTGHLLIAGQHEIDFRCGQHLVFSEVTLAFHSNGLRLEAFDAQERVLLDKTYYSVGGGFIVDDSATNESLIVADSTVLPFAFDLASELLAHCRRTGMSVSQVMLENEKSWRTEEQIRLQLLHIWAVMQACVARGCVQDGVLPGGLNLRRRAPALYRKLTQEESTKAFSASESGSRPAGSDWGDLDWVDLWALAVNEENAAGGRVVTAPTNGAAGIIPAVLHYYHKYTPWLSNSETRCPTPTDATVRFLLTAAAIGTLFKKNASISGAEVGCQGEVGSACSMAAAGLAELMGGTPEQVENAAEIGMEHNLGLTCDPIRGLVQVPCIERNAMAAVKAINAARLALRGDGNHFVSLDKVIKTMRETGLDMQTKYKETARGGLAVNVIEC